MVDRRLQAMGSGWARSPSPSSRGSNSGERKRWRREVLARDDYQCVLRINSNCTGEATQVDHVVPVSVAPELELEVDNGQSCCRYCHASKSASESHVRRPKRKRPPYQHPADFL